MIDYKNVQRFLYETLIKSHPGKILVERTETNKKGTTYVHKHWINPDEIKETDRVLIGQKHEDKENYVKHMLNKFKSWIDGLTGSEKQTLQQYTTFAYEDVNSHLRGNMKEIAKLVKNPKVWEDIDTWIDNLESALNKV